MRDGADQRTAVIQLARLGDLAQTWRLIQRLKAASTGQNVCLLVEGNLAPLAALMVGSENTISIDVPTLIKTCRDGRDGWKAARSLQRRLLDIGVDAAINLTWHPAAAALGEAIPANRRLGARWRDVKSNRPSDEPLRLLFAGVSGLRRGTRHLSDIWAEYAGNDSNPEFQPLTLTDDVIETGRQILSSAGINGGEISIAIAVGSGLNARSLKPEVIRDISGALAGIAPVVLVGSKREAKVAAQICEQIKTTSEHFPVASGVSPDTPVVSVPCDTSPDSGVSCGTHDTTSLCGLTDNPAHLAGVLANCRLVIGVDTGPLHVAAMIGTPCLGMYYGSMHFRETGPYGDGHVVIAPDDPDYPCHEREMDQSPEKYADLIPARVVIEAARAMLTDEAILDFNGFRIFRSQIGVDGLAWDEISSQSVVDEFEYGQLNNARPA